MRKQMLALFLSFSIFLLAFSLTGCNDRKSKVYFLNFKPEFTYAYIKAEEIPIRVINDIKKYGEWV